MRVGEREYVCMKVSEREGTVGEREGRGRDRNRERERREFKGKSVCESE